MTTFSHLSTTRVYADTAHGSQLIGEVTENPDGWWRATFRGEFLTSADGRITFPTRLSALSALEAAFVDGQVKR